MRTKISKNLSNFTWMGRLLLLKALLMPWSRIDPWGQTRI